MEYDWMSLTAAVLLVGATIPQAVRLFRTRNADDFSTPFCALNAAGILLLLLRSIQFGDAGFILVNSVTFSFWACLLGFKLARPTRRAAGAAVTLKPVLLETSKPRP